MKLSDHVVEIMMKELKDNLHEGYTCVSAGYPSWALDIAREYCNNQGIKLTIV